jgi:hypothetical protein
MSMAASHDVHVALGDRSYVVRIAPGLLAPRDARSPICCRDRAHGS